MIGDWKKISSIISRFKDLTTLGTANVVSSAISAIFWFYMASLLGTEHYGEVSYFLSIAGIVSTISFLGSGSTIIVYTAKGEKIQSTIYLVTIIASVISSIVVFLLVHNPGVGLYVVGYGLFNLATADIIGRKLYKDYSKYLITQKILFVIAALGFYYLMGPQGVIIGFAASFYPYFYRIYVGFKESKPSSVALKSHFGFMMNSYTLDLSRAFSGNIDKLIVAPMLGFSLLGNYQLGNQFLSLLGLLPAVVYQYILPHDASGNPNKKLKKATIIVSIFIAVLGITLSPIIVPVLFPKFKESVEVIQIISLAIIPSTINLIYLSKFLGSEKNKIVVVGSGIYLLAQVFGILVLGKTYGINGVTAALVLASSAEAIYLFLMSKFYHKQGL